VIYHADLTVGYRKAEGYVRRLRKYHEGRLERLIRTGDAAALPEDGNAFEGVAASPYLNEPSPHESSGSGTTVGGSTSRWGEFVVWPGQTIPEIRTA
jgi:hypothetical protein